MDMQTVSAQHFPSSPVVDASDSPGSSGAGSKFKCDQCSSTFQRSEHLKRHQRTHSAENRPFICNVCSKGFSRSDTLNRHMQIHSYPYGGITSFDGSSWMNPPGNRACYECAKARAKCSKGRICSRCTSRSLACIYPTRRKRRRRPDEIPLEPLSGEEVELDSDVPSGQPTDMIMSIPQDVGAFSMADHDTQPEIHGVTPRSLSGHNPPQNKGLGLHSLATASSIYDQIQRDSSMTGESLPQPSSAVPNYLSAGSVTGIGPSLATQSPSPYDFDVVTAGTVNTNLNDTPVPFQMGYDSPVYDSTFNAPLNWLPPNFEANIDYTSILGLDFSTFSHLADSPGALNQHGLTSPVRGSFGFQQQDYVDHIIRQRIDSEPRAPSEITSPAQILSQSPLSVQSMSGDSTNGALYATSTDGARLSSTVRFKKQPIAVYGGEPISPSSSTKPIDDRKYAYGFPILTNIIIEGFSSNSQASTLILPSTYNTIYESFTQTCLSSSTLWLSFDNPSFPLSSHMSYFAYLYFENFHPTFPILHKASIDLNDYWPLALAVAAVGCQYTDTEEFSRCVVPMHEFLRRVIAMQTEHNDLNAALVQTILLSQIGMLYSGSQRLVARARGGHGRLVDVCRQHDLLVYSRSRTQSLVTQFFLRSSISGDSASTMPHDSSAFVSDWRSWVRNETKARLGYAIWLLDCMRYYQYDLDSCLSLAECKVPLPHDGLWEAMSASQWSALYEKHIENPSLVEAVQKVYVEGKVKEDLGEFSRVILLHGIYQETWDVSMYFKRPLAFWQSSVGKELHQNADHRSNCAKKVADLGPSRWLPEIPTYLNWRNATCDCVDVLHWTANARIAQHNGVEHPTIFHLHFARTILLTPYEKLRTLALSIIASTQNSPNGTIRTNASSRDASEAEHDVLRWAQQDERKARLAVLHAGCLVWHVRRYSMRSFYEPAAIFLATLALWGYSSYTSLKPPRERGQTKINGSNNNIIARPRASREPNSPPNTSANPAASSPTESDFEAYESDTADPTFILLDRPNDDEMVQLFVRQGHPSNMRAFITGVGHICAPTGPSRILKQGQKLLAKTAPVWGCAREYTAVLEALEKVMEERLGRSEKRAE